jgi:hypothetical protein
MRAREHELGLLLTTIPALLDAAVRLADHVERLTLLDGQVVVTVAGEPRVFRAPADALAVAEGCADYLRVLCRGAAGEALADLLARPFTVESCAAIKAELARVRELVTLAQHGGEAAA